MLRQRMLPVFVFACFVVAVFAWGNTDKAYGKDWKDGVLIVDSAGKSGKTNLKGEVKKVGEDYVFNGVFSFLSSATTPNGDIKLQIVLYKDKKEVESIEVKAIQAGDVFKINDFHFATKSEFDSVGYKSNWVGWDNGVLFVNASAANGKTSLKGEVKKTGVDYVFNGVFNVVSDGKISDNSMDLHVILYKNKEKVDSFSVRAKQSGGVYKIEDFHFTTKSDFDSVGYKSNWYSKN